MKKLILIGAGGFGREVAWVAERINKISPQWELTGFLDDSPELEGKTLNGLKVLGGLSKAAEYPDAYYMCTVGSSAVRKKIIENLKAILPQARFATLIDPSVEMSDYVSVGEGTVICAHNILTVNIDIGNHVIINLDCTVGHDTVMKDFVTLYPSVNVSGGASIGSCAELGTGMQILQYKSVGDNSIVGAGSVVTKDIPANCTAVGVPAKPIKFFDI